MNIVYACDDKYAMLVAVSVESLYSSNKDQEAVNVYVLTSNVTEANLAKLSQVAEKHHRVIRFVPMTSSILNDNELTIDVQRWSIAAFSRLFAPQLLPELNRIIYLDCDTLIMGSLDEIWNMDLAATTCAAVAEPFSAMHKRNVQMHASDVYYNSGMMLIDLEKWRTTGMREKFIASIQRHRGRVPYVDQGVINEVFRGQIARIPAKYNVYTEYYDFSYEEVNRYRADKSVYGKAEIEEAKQKPVVVHLVSSFLTPRPWVEHSSHPYAKIWDAYCDATPWADTVKWPDNPGKAKLALRWMFQHLPRVLCVWIACVLNSYIRPMLDSRYIVKDGNN